MNYEGVQGARRAEQAGTRAPPDLQSSHQTVKARIVGDNLRHWKGTIFGPVSRIALTLQSDTAYEGGVFVINIEIP